MAEQVAERVGGLRLPAVWPARPRGESGGSGDATADPEADRRRGSLRLWSSGFIANRRELADRTGLSPAATDAELLLALYVRHGTDTASLICGPFAWILEDPARRRLVAVRDRAGTVGIFWAESAGGLVVGDRVGQMRPHLARPGELNRRSLAVQCAGLAPVPGETCFAGVRSLDRGSMLIGSESGVRVERYWRLEPPATLRLRSDADYAEALRAKLFEVVGEYRPERPCAATVSSGLDSTSVAAALLAAGPGAGVHLLTFGLSDLPDSDETAGAAAVAQHLGLELEVIQSSQRWPLSDPGSWRLLEEGTLVNYQELWDELYRRVRRRGLEVAFSGISGDHLFGGTGVLVYPDLLLSGRWRRLARRLVSHHRAAGVSWGRLLAGHLVKPLVRACLPRRWAAARRRLPWLRSEFQGALLDYPPRPPAGRRLLPGRYLRVEALHDPMLAHGTSLVSLRAAEEGIELRHPLTDHRLLELAASLPLDQCLRGDVPKWILRNAMRGHLPERVLDARERILPSALLARGLREREETRVRELITGMRAAELDLVDERELQRAYDRYVEGAGSAVFWHTLTVEAWLRRYA